MASIIGVETLQHTNGTTAATIDSSGRLIGSKAGSLIQTQYKMYTSTTTVATTAATDTVVSDLTVKITPTSSSSIIKIEAMINGEWSNSDGTTDGVWFFYRDSTKLSHAAAGNRNVGILASTAISYPNAANAASTPEVANYMYFDAPATTSEITYKVGVNTGSGYTWHMNKTVSDTDNSGHERGISLICVTEIAG